MELLNINNEKDININISFNIDTDILTKVANIINEVKNNKDKALFDFTKKFDNINLKEIEVKDLNSYKDKIDDNFLKILKKTISNIEVYQSKTLSSSWVTIDKDETILGELVNPIEKVGLYIPGGTAPLISSVLMSAIPAYLAGVKEIIVCTPPDKTGNINPYILAAAKYCKVTRVFKVGGAQSIAAMAYGTETIPKVDKIIGPGNIFVTTAKKLVYGDVNIDMIAGPSEICVFADNTVKKDNLIFDLLSQAEHDVIASSYLVTTSKEIAEFVKNNIYSYAEKLSRFEIIKKSLDKNFKIFLVKDNTLALKVINKIAPEHLEICVEKPELVVKKIKNAGAIFVGNYTPEPVGDYFAGPSHILPTSGTARFFSPVSASTFIKKSSLIWYSKKTFDNNAENIIRLAELEELTAHLNSVKIRTIK